jgi:hypothetical protein
VEGFALLKVDKRRLRYYISGAFKVVETDARSPERVFRSISDGDGGRRTAATRHFGFPAAGRTRARQKNLGER